jgi:hypothetical protein
MGVPVSDLRDNVLSKLPPDEKKRLGKAGLTYGEAQAKQAAREEKELQRQIANLLRLKGIEANVSRMDKRKTDRKSWGDFTFAANGQAVIWECKRPGEKLRDDQEAMRKKLIAAPNEWQYFVIHTVEDGIRSLRQLGVIG